MTENEKPKETTMEVTQAPRMWRGRPARSFQEIRHSPPSTDGGWGRVPQIPRMSRGIATFPVNDCSDCDLAEHGSQLGGQRDRYGC